MPKYHIEIWVDLAEHGSLGAVNEMLRDCRADVRLSLDAPIKSYEVSTTIPLTAEQMEQMAQITKKHTQDALPGKTVRVKIRHAPEEITV